MIIPHFVHKTAQKYERLAQRHTIEKRNEQACSQWSPDPLRTARAKFLSLSPFGKCKYHRL